MSESFRTVLREWLLNSEGRGVFGRRGGGWEVESSQQFHHWRTGSPDWGARWILLLVIAASLIHLILSGYTS